MTISAQYLASLLFAAFALGYGVSIIRRWQHSWFWERSAFYSLTVTAAVFFIWSRVI